MYVMYTRYLAKHILLCLLYATLSCVWQLSRTTDLFFSCYPLLTLYYGVLSYPPVHQLYEYNTVEHTIPKWSYLYRAYFHVVLLEQTPTAGIFSVFTLLLLMQWKDLRFLVARAEKRLKTIDLALYDHPSTKRYRLAHLHFGVFEDDTCLRAHRHRFHSSALSVVPHSYESERAQNGIVNYVEFRTTRARPGAMNEWEQGLWRASLYRDVFVANREVYVFWPIAYVLLGVCAAFYVRLSLRIYLSALLLTGDIVCTCFASQATNDVFVDVLYFLVAASAVRSA